MPRVFQQAQLYIESVIHRISVIELAINHRGVLELILKDVSRGLAL